MTYALQVLEDPDDDGQWHWVVLEQHPEHAGTFTPHSAGDCGFDTFADALNSGTLGLAQAVGQPYENEAADPVGYAECAVVSGLALAPKQSGAYVSRDDQRKVGQGEARSVQPSQTSNRYGTPLHKPTPKP